MSSTLYISVDKPDQWPFILRRVAVISDEIGRRGLLVRAEAERTRDFYIRRPKAETSPLKRLDDWSATAP